MRPSVICSADPSLHRGKSPPATPSLSGMASCRTMRLGTPQPPSPPCTPARARDDKGKPPNSIQGIREALRGYRLPIRADPSHGTDCLTDRLAPSCHERPSAGLWSRAGPSTQNWAPCAGYLGHGVAGGALAEGWGWSVATSGSTPEVGLQPGVLPFTPTPSSAPRPSGQPKHASKA